MTKRGRKLKQTMHRRMWVKRGSPRTIVTVDASATGKDFTATMVAHVVRDRMWVKALWVTDAGRVVHAEGC